MVDGADDFLAKATHRGLLCSLGTGDARSFRSLLVERTGHLAMSMSNHNMLMLMALLLYRSTCVRISRALTILGTIRHHVPLLLPSFEAAPRSGGGSASGQGFSPRIDPQQIRYMYIGRTSLHDFNFSSTLTSASYPILSSYLKLVTHLIPLL